MLETFNDRHARETRAPQFARVLSRFFPWPLWCGRPARKEPFGACYWERTRADAPGHNNRENADRVILHRDANRSRSKRTPQADRRTGPLMARRVTPVTRLARLWSVLDGGKTMLIVMQNNPDPDAIAAAEIGRASCRERVFITV